MNVYKTSLVHREYGIRGMDNRRVDLVIFPSDSVNKINNPNLMIDGKYITPSAAFELGTEKTVNFEKHFKSDLNKLDELVSQGMERGYYIHFHKDTTLSASGSERRKITEDNIKGKLKDVVKTIKDCEDIKNHKDIKILVFILGIYRINQHRIWGKCEMFNTKTQEWEKVGIYPKNGKLEEHIRNIL